MLGHDNDEGVFQTIITSDAALATFIGRNTWPQSFTSPAHGVQGECQSRHEDSSGVRGVALNPTGAASGVRGEALGDEAPGVYGENENGYGVVGRGKSAGVWGQATEEASAGVLADGADEGDALRANGDVTVLAEDGKVAFRVEAEGPYVAGQTAIFVRRNDGVTVAVERVSVGAPNSGGNGFRVLRIPN